MNKIEKFNHNVTVWNKRLNANAPMAKSLPMSVSDMGIRQSALARVVVYKMPELRDNIEIINKFCKVVYRDENPGVLLYAHLSTGTGKTITQLWELARCAIAERASAHAGSLSNPARVMANIITSKVR